MSSKVLSVLLEWFDYLNYVEFFDLTLQISVGIWCISSILSLSLKQSFPESLLYQH